jgi:hypothetical protein
MVDDRGHRFEESRGGRWWTSLDEMQRTVNPWVGRSSHQPPGSQPAPISQHLAACDKRSRKRTAGMPHDLLIVG